MKKVIAFDLDDTLAVTKSPVSDRMSQLLIKLLNKFEVCIISGGNFDQFKKQIVDRLEANNTLLRKLHLMPTCGTRYYRFDDTEGIWKLQYAEDLSSAQKHQIIKSLTDGAKQLGLWEKNPKGKIIEDRGSQITFSALGQQALAEDKYSWDPDGHKKQALRNLVASQLPDLEVRTGGTTSIDVTRIGIDKAYGMDKLMAILELVNDEVLFIGDNLEEGGNDYPVKAMGIDTIAVERWEDTAFVIEGILAGLT